MPCIPYKASYDNVSRKPHNSFHISYKLKGMVALRLCYFSPIFVSPSVISSIVSLTRMTNFLNDLVSKVHMKIGKKKSEHELFFYLLMLIFLKNMNLSSVYFILEHNIK